MTTAHHEDVPRVVRLRYGREVAEVRADNLKFPARYDRPLPESYRTIHARLRNQAVFVGLRSGGASSWIWRLFGIGVLKYKQVRFREQTVATFFFQILKHFALEFVLVASLLPYLFHNTSFFGVAVIVGILVISDVGLLLFDTHLFFRSTLFLAAWRPLCMILCALNMACVVLFARLIVRNFVELWGGPISAVFVVTGVAVRQAGRAANAAWRCYRNLTRDINGVTFFYYHAPYNYIDLDLHEDREVRNHIYADYYGHVMIQEHDLPYVRALQASMDADEPASLEEFAERALEPVMPSNVHLRPAIVHEGIEVRPIEDSIQKLKSAGAGVAKFLRKRKQAIDKKVETLASVMDEVNASADWEDDGESSS